MFCLPLLGACATSIPPRAPATRHGAHPPLERATSRPTATATSRPVGAAPASQATAGPAPQPAAGSLPSVIRCGDKASKQVALTFDDGPYTRHRQTERILAILKKRRVKASFFLLGRMVRRYPHLVRRIAEAGHLIATHSWDHPRRASIAEWRQQFERTNEVLRAAGVKASRFYRPPHGIVTAEVEALCRRLGYTIVLYTLLSSDWRKPGAEALRREVVGRTRSGGIVVLHDGGGDRRQTVEALPGIIDGLRRKGLEPVRLDALFEGGAHREGCGRQPQQRGGYGALPRKKEKAP